MKLRENPKFISSWENTPFDGPERSPRGIKFRLKIEGVFSLIGWAHCPLNIQSTNGVHRRIGIEYSIVGLIGWAHCPLNIQSTNGVHRQIGIEYSIVGLIGWAHCPLNTQSTKWIA